MALRQLFAGLLLITSLAGYGCKEEDDLEVKTNPTEENVCAEAAEVVCHNAFQCCVGGELESVFGVELTTTEKDCRRDVELKCQQKYASVFYSLENKRISLNLKQITTCLTQALAPDDGCFPYEALDEAAWSDCDDVKSDMLSGLVAVGDACDFDYECAGEAICTEGRTCKSLRGLNETCLTDSECQSALHCGLNALFERVCVADVALGGACASDGECQEELYCNMVGVGLTPDTDSDTDTTPPGKCAAPQANGSACSANYVSTNLTGNYTSDRECVSGNCLPGTCADGRGECETAADCMGSCSLTGNDCTTVADCSKACVGGYYDGNACMDSTDCVGTCSLSGDYCGSDLECASMCVSSTGGTTGYACLSTAECETYYGTGYTCDPQTCDNMGVCTALETCDGVSTCGGRVCAEEYGVTNYCYAGWNWFEISPATFGD